jgi:hypothetical protein
MGNLKVGWYKDKGKYLQKRVFELALRYFQLPPEVVTRIYGSLS